MANAYAVAKSHILKREAGEIEPDDKLVLAREKRTPGKLGRPKGSKARTLDLAHKLFSSNGDKVLRKIIEIALEDGNPNQMQALKMCADRIAPVSFFDDLAKSGAGNNINIMVNVVAPDAQPSIVGPAMSGDVVDVEVKEVKHG